MNLGEPEGKNTFGDRVTDYIGDDGVGARKLADEFEAAIGTVRRWALGISTPHKNVVILADRFMEANPRPHQVARQKNGLKRFMEML